MAQSEQSEQGNQKRKRVPFTDEEKKSRRLIAQRKYYKLKRKEIEHKNRFILNLSGNMERFETYGFQVIPPAGWV